MLYNIQLVFNVPEELGIHYKICQITFTKAAGYLYSVYIQKQSFETSFWKIEYHKLVPYYFSRSANEKFTSTQELS